MTTWIFHEAPKVRVLQLRQPLEQTDRLGEHLLLLGREAPRDRAGQPPLAPTAILLERPTPGVGELEEGAAPVGRIGTAGDQALGFQLGERLTHRLGPYAFGDGEVGRTPGPLAVQATEHGAVRQRQAVLGPQPARELAKDHPELAGEEADVHAHGHPQTI